MGQVKTTIKAIRCDKPAFRAHALIYFHDEATQECDNSDIVFLVMESIDAT